MKTRVISTEIWDEDKVFCLNIDTKLLYLVLLTNPYIGQSRFYKINDRQLSTYSGLNVEQIQKCKRDLEEQKMVFFKNGYVCVTGFGFVECFYKGSKNKVAKTRELEKIPDDVLCFFREKLDTLSIPYLYPSDTTINHKSIIINNKLEIINTKKEGNPIKLVSYLEAIPKDDIDFFCEKFHITEKDVSSKAEDLLNYCKSKGKVYKDYKAFLSNALKRDYPQKTLNTKTY